MSYSYAKLLTFYTIVLLITYAFVHINSTEAQIQDWTSSTMPLYSSSGDLQDLEYSSTSTLDELEDQYQYLDEFDHDQGDHHHNRRSLYWKSLYYISYGALSANRVPCPPRSGMSYYTHHCFKARGPANPYTRGCSCISRCRR